LKYKTESSTKCATATVTTSRRVALLCDSWGLKEYRTFPIVEVRYTSATRIKINE
jgi:hypothetical protein